MTARLPQVLSFRRVKDSQGDRVVAAIVLQGIRGEPVEQWDVTQDHALQLLSELATAIGRVGRGGW